MATLAGLLGEGCALADGAEEVFDVVGHLGEGDGLVAAGEWVGDGAEKPGGFAGGAALVAFDVVEGGEGDGGGAAEGLAEVDALFVERKCAIEHGEGEDAEKQAQGQLVTVDFREPALKEERDIDGEGVDGEGEGAEKEGEGAGAKGIDEIGLAEAVAVRAWLAAAGDEGGEEAHEGLQQKFHVFGG